MRSAFAGPSLIALTIGFLSSTAQAEFSGCGPVMEQPNAKGEVFKLKPLPGRPSAFSIGSVRMTSSPVLLQSLLDNPDDASRLSEALKERPVSLRAFYSLEKRKVLIVPSFRASDRKGALSYLAESPIQDWISVRGDYLPENLLKSLSSLPGIRRISEAPPAFSEDVLRATQIQSYEMSTNGLEAEKLVGNLESLFLLGGQSTSEIRRFKLTTIDRARNLVLLFGNGAVFFVVAHYIDQFPGFLIRWGASAALFSGATAYIASCLKWNINHDDEPIIQKRREEIRRYLESFLNQEPKDPNVGKIFGEFYPAWNRFLETTDRRISILGLIADTNILDRPDDYDRFLPEGFNQEIVRP